MKTIFAIFALAASAFAQGSPVNQVSDPPPSAIQKLFYYDGSSNLQYICSSPQRNATTTQKRSDSTLTSIAVATNVATVTTNAAHGLYIGARVTVSGATVDTDLNGTYTVASVPGSTSYTFTTSAVADATYNESTLVVTTTYPLATSARWAIQVFTYSGSNVTAAYWANASTGYSLACTSRTSY
jgi:hypothetical protein